MDLFSNLEVSISIQEDKYKAKSSAFPDCVGVGETEALALKSLSRSIARFISKISNEALNSVFTSERYSEVILDTTSEAKQQNRVYNLDSGFMSFAKHLYLKVKKTQPGESEKMSIELEELLKKESPREARPQADLLEGVGFKVQQKEDAADGGIVFGFMVNFN